MLTLNDGRSELWQWDTGRTLSVDRGCTQVHFSNKVFGRSIDVDVVDGVAIIPDILLQTDKELNVWAFVGMAENGYTKISKSFKVNRRNKPADYVFTPPEQTTLAEIMERLDDLELIQDPDAIKNAVEDYLEQNPVEAPVQSVNGKTGKVELTSEDVGAISQDDLQKATNEVLEQAKASGEFDGAPGADGKDYVLTKTDKAEIAEMAAELIDVPDSGGNPDQSGLSTTAANLLITILRNGVYSTDQSDNITALAAELGVTEEEPDEPDIPVEPDIPDEPDEPEVTLTSISATYSGGEVTVGTALTDLTGIVVTAHYSDGTSETVTGYTLSGTIAEGNNTVTVTYQGKTATFAVTGVAESGGDDATIVDAYTAYDWTEGIYLSGASGGENTGSSWAAWSSSEFISLENVSRIVVDSEVYGFFSYRMYFYDANKTNGTGSSNSNGNMGMNHATSPSPVEIVIPDGSAYVRFTAKTDTLNSRAVIYKLYEQ